MSEIIYRPQHKKEKELKDDFVVRLVEYEKLMNSIKADQSGKTPQHIILQGQRGMGKTTLIYRVYYQVLKEYREKHLIPVMFSEEQYSVRTLYKLWEQVALFLEDNETEYSGIWYQIQEMQHLEDYETKCFEVIQKRISKNKHRVLLLIDNFGVMIEKFTKQDQQRFREILTTFPALKIIGGSSVVLESFYRYDKPFFDFFKIIQLNPLTSNEVKTLLLRLGEKHKSTEVKEIVENQSGRVESIRILAGGVPRTIVLLFNIFLDSDNGNSIDDLKKLLDMVTPLYKHRMDELPAQQQEIVDKLALNWDGMSVSELVVKTRMESKAISAQLNSLIKNGVVSSRKSTGKNNYYLLEERFFNIWYLMQHAPRNAQQKVIWLTRFLELWCSNNRLEKNASTFKKRLENETMKPEYVKAMTFAYARTHGISSKTRDLLITSAQRVLKNIDGETSENLPLKLGDLFKKMQQLLKQKEYNKATALVSRGYLSDLQSNILQGIINDIAGKDKLAAQFFDKANALNSHSFFDIGILYNDKFKDYKKAEKYFKLAIKDRDFNALYFLGYLYQENLNDYKQAEKYYLLAVKNIDIDAMVNLGDLYTEQYKEHRKAKKYYLMAIEYGNDNAMVNLGDLYAEQYKDFKKAEEYYLMAIEKKNVYAMEVLGDLYTINLRDFKKAENCYLMAIEYESIEAMWALGKLNEDQFKNVKKAEKYFKLAAKNGNKDALNNLGIIYADNYNDFKKAEKYFLKAIKKEDINAIYNLINWKIELNSGNKIENVDLLFSKIFDLKTISETKLFQAKLLQVKYLLWINEAKQATILLENILNNILIIEYDYEDSLFSLHDILIFAIAKGLKQYILKLFKNENYQLKDRFRVLYYALAMLLEDEYPNELKKMGAELKEPVNELVKEIKELEIKYSN
ncbi:MAG: hypothetical protein L3J06_03875 [Cyclobacteriaceae bacterium]|nr:hypothetical protein [Cyclobacteriaceae bacterium]